MSVLAASREVRRRPPWRLLALPALVVPAVAALAWFAPTLDLWSVLGLGGLIVAAACVLLRSLMPSLFGPILWYDLVGTARRGRYVFVRCLYLAALLGMLFVLYTKWFGGASVFDVFTAESIDRNRVSAFNDSFFEMFVTVQFLVLVLLTPGVTAGAIAEEKDRKTLEYLLSSDLHNHEIVLGKLVSRLAYLTLVLLAGLPVLGLLQLLGGVDPGLVLGSFAVTALTMLSLATLSIFNSVYATKPRTAIVLTYVLVAAYFVLTLGSLWVWDAGSMPWPVKWVCGGNPYVAVQELRFEVMSQAPAVPPFLFGTGLAPAPAAGPADFLPPILLRYAACHLTVTLLCLVGSLVGLRLWARWQASGRTRRAYVIAITQPRLPRVSGRPMLWKELHTEPLFRLGEAAQIVITTFVALGLIFVVFVLISVVTVGLMLGNLQESMNTTVRLMGTVLAALMVLGTAVRAAGAISGERDRQTMETLLTTPLENDTIVWSKWWGSVLGVRKAGYALLLLWVVGVATGGLSPAALPLLLLALFAYLAFAASLGLWFSLRSRTTLRATIGTLVALTGISLGHWLLAFCCSPLALLASASPPPVMSGPAPSPGWTELLAEVQKYTLTPPVTMAALTFSNREVLDIDLFYGTHRDEDGLLGARPVLRLGLCFVGIMFYGLLAMVLLMLTAARFTVVTGRLPLPGTVPRRLAGAASPPYLAEGLIAVNDDDLRWLLGELSPSAFRRSWRQRLAVALVLAGAALLAWHGGALPAWPQAALWGALLAAVAVLSRRGWLTLFGPVLLYDLIRTARRGRTFLLRTAYALALLVVLFLVYNAHVLQGDPLDVSFGEAHINIQELSQFGADFFLNFLGVQFVTVFLLTPVLTAAAIAEEKEKKTLEYLLATDLANREIVLGKLASRLLGLLLLLAGGLPVLSFVQFFGGVDPNLVLAGFAATVMTMLSLGSLGILLSAYAPRPRGAILSTYVFAGSYLLASSCCLGMPVGTMGGLNPLEWLSAGNIVVAYERASAGAAAAGGLTGGAVLSVLADYAAFHALAAAVLAGLATLKLRAWARESRPPAGREAGLPHATRATVLSPARAGLRLPRVGDDPILWKELYVERTYRPQRATRAVLVFLAAALLAGAGLVFLCGVAGVTMEGAAPSEFASTWVQVVGTTVGCLMIVAVAVRASTVFGSERDRQTLDGLLTTPLPNGAILSGKWLASLLSVRQAWWCLGIVWMMGFLAGGLHVLSLLLLLASWWAYAAFAAGLGVWFSLRCRTTLRATVWTLLALVFTGVAPSLWCGVLGAVAMEELFPNRRIEPGDLVALSPPGGMAALVFGWGEWHSFDREMVLSVGRVALAWVGVCLYALAAAALWVVARARFGRITGRMPYR